MVSSCSTPRKEGALWSGQKKPYMKHAHLLGLYGMVIGAELAKDCDEDELLPGWLAEPVQHWSPSSKSSYSSSSSVSTSSLYSGWCCVLLLGDLSCTESAERSSEGRALRWGGAPATSGHSKPNTQRVGVSRHSMQFDDVHKISQLKLSIGPADGPTYTQVHTRIKGVC